MKKVYEAPSVEIRLCESGENFTSVSYDDVNVPSSDLEF